VPAPPLPPPPRPSPPPSPPPSPSPPLPPSPPPSFTCAAGDDATTCRILGELYAATGGPSWTVRTGWSAAAAGTPTSMLTFFGVNKYTSASSAGSTLLSLGLRNNSLVGTLPASLGSLSAVTVLDLYGNDLCGAIPPPLAARCALSGVSCYDLEPTALKPSLKSCTPVSADGFRCLESDDQGTCAALYKFWRGSGGAPGGGAWSTTQRSRWIDAAQGNPVSTYCNYTAVECAANTTAITKINLNQALLTGTVAPALGSLVTLTYLSLNSNALFGTLPTELGSLTALTHLCVAFLALLRRFAPPPCVYRARSHALHIFWLTWRSCVCVRAQKHGV
jgi:hypothetical protein